jgi:hypothetical protein
MRASILSKAIVAACLIAGLSGILPRAPYAHGGEGTDVPEPSAWSLDEIIVKFNEDANQVARDTLLWQHGCHVSRTCEDWDVYPPTYCLRSRAPIHVRVADEQIVQSF